MKNYNKKQICKVFLEEEYGYRQWVWTFHGTKEELIEAWKNGFVPLQKNAIGYFIERIGLRTGGSSFAPKNGLKPESECKGTIKNIFSQYGKTISRRKEKSIKIYAHVHTTYDTYLKVDGITYDWTFKEDFA